MRNLLSNIAFIALLCSSTVSFAQMGNIEEENQKIKERLEQIDQDLNKNEREIAAMDSLAEALENQSNGLENKLAEAEQKIEAAQEKLEQDKAQASWGRYLKIIIAAIALAAIVFVLMRRRKK